MKLYDYLNLHVGMVETGAIIDFYKSHPDPNEQSEKVYLTNLNLEREILYFIKLIS